MFTLFTTGKPFAGHSGIIQRNALKSWTLLHPDVEVIVFGDEEGAAEACRDLGLRHEAHEERNEAGLKRIHYFFDRAQALPRRPLLFPLPYTTLSTPMYFSPPPPIKS